MSRKINCPKCSRTLLLDSDHSTIVNGIIQCGCGRFNNESPTQKEISLKIAEKLIGSSLLRLVLAA